MICFFKVSWFFVVITLSWFIYENHFKAGVPVNKLEPFLSVWTDWVRYSHLVMNKSSLTGTSSNNHIFQSKTIKHPIFMFRQYITKNHGHDNASFPIIKWAFDTPTELTLGFVSFNREARHNAWKQ